MTMSEAPARVLIVRLGSLGDLVHTLPALAELRDAWPNAEIDWVVEQPHAEFLALVPHLSQVIVLGERTAAGWWEVMRTLRARQYDIAIDLQGLIKSASLARFSSAKRVVGFNAEALREKAARLFYSEAIEVDDERHVIEKNLALVRGLIGEHEARPFTFALAEPASPALARLRSQGLGDFAVINRPIHSRRLRSSFMTRLAGHRSSCGDRANRTSRRRSAMRPGALRAWLHQRGSRTSWRLRGRRNCLFQEIRGRCTSPGPRARRSWRSLVRRRPRGMVPGILGTCRSAGMNPVRATTSASVTWKGSGVWDKSAWMK
jgi:hypothetical protein